MSTQEQRERFEVAFRVRVGNTFSLERLTDDEGDEVYAHDWVQGAWIGWLAAEAAAIERCAIRAAIHSQYPITTEFDRGYDKARKDCASAIRALLNDGGA